MNRQTHQNSGNELRNFGLLPKRLAHFAMEKPGNAAAKSVEKRIDEQNETDEKLLREMGGVARETIGSYNAKFHDGLPNDLSEAKDQIAQLLAPNKDGSSMKDVNPERFQALLDISNQINFINATKINKHGERLLLMAERVREGCRLREEWRQRAEYQEALNVFDSGTSAILNQDFSALTEGSDGRFNREIAQRNKRLFFAIMSQYTDGFTKETGEILGEKHEENIARFPHLFHSWMEIRAEDLNSSISQRNTEIAAVKASISGSRSLAEILGSVKSAGTPYENILQIPPNPSINFWQERMSTLRKYLPKLIDHARKENPETHSGNRREAAEDLKMHIKHAELELRKARDVAKREELEKEFVGSKMTNKESRISFMKMMLMRFQEAVKQVDKPTDNGNWQSLLHPTVRALLIANVMRRPMGHVEMGDGTREYQEARGSQNAWMMDIITRSGYFNTEVSGIHLTPEHRMALQIAHVGQQAAWHLEVDTQVASMIDKMLAAKSDPERYNALEDELVREYGQYLPDYKQGENWLIAKREEIEANNTKRRELLEAAEQFFMNPKAPKSRAWFDELDVDGDGIIDEGKSNFTYVEADSLTRFQADMEEVEGAYHMLDFAEKVNGKADEAEMLEAMQINVRGIYRRYREELAEGNVMSVDDWDIRSNPEAIAHDLEILLNETGGGGKENLLFILTTMRDEIPSDETNHRIHQQRTEAISIVRMIQEQIKAEERVIANKKSIIPFVEKRLKGHNIFETVTDAGGVIVDMAFGGGRSWSERAVGIGAIYMGFKLFRKGLKMEGKTGKMMGMALLFLGGTKVVEEMTGKSAEEWLGLRTIENAAEGTHEGYLLKNGEEYMEQKNISKEEHYKSLRALKNVPLEKVMKWHKKVDPNGEGYDPSSETGALSEQEELSLFNEMGINASKIVDSTYGGNKSIRGRSIFYETVSHFFHVIAEKDEKTTMVDARNAIEERWITLVRDPEKSINHTDFWFGHQMADQYGSNMDKITFGMMLETEITPHMVESTIGENLPDQAVETVKGWAATLSKWMENKVLDPGSGHAEEFLADLGDEADWVVDELDDLAEAANVKYEFTKESIILTYEENKWELRRTGENMWRLFKMGVSIPPKAIYAGVNIVGSKGETIMRQAMEIMSPSTESKPRNGVFGVEDIAGDSAFIGAGPDRQINRNRAENPEFGNFGLFQDDFYEAHQAGLDNPGSAESEGGVYYHESADRIGYTIVRMDMKAAGIEQNDPLFANHPDNAFSRMSAMARDRAVRNYIAKGIPVDYVEGQMYEIHTVKQSDPPAIYAFFRMPRPNSDEGIARLTGNFMDDLDPRKWMHRMPTTFERGESAWEKMKKMTDVENKGVRKTLKTVGSIGMQPFYLWRSGMEAIGYTAQDIAEMVLFKEDEHKAAWMGEVLKTKESTNQVLDEWSASAISHPLPAHSEFYGNRNFPENAQMYELALNYAIANDQEDPYLGFFEGTEITVRKGPKQEKIEYQGRAYLQKPDGFTYEHFVDYYNREWVPKNGEIKNFDAFIANGRKILNER